MLASAQALEQSLRRAVAEMERAEARARGERVPDVFEDVYPLTMHPGFFKGKRPVGIIFPNGDRVEVSTWKRLVEVLLGRCNQDRGRHDALMKLRNRIQGRDRTLLGSSVEGMRSPLMIDKGLFMETHYDTETLLRITLGRILDPVGYDYEGIRVALRNDPK